MKTCEEWDIAFDQLYNNISSNKAPGITKYEKSLFLTNAQEQVVKALYNGNSGRAFEETEEVTRYLDALVKQASCEEAVGDSVTHLKPSTHVFKLPDDLLFRTFEWCRVSIDGCGETCVDVTPVTQDEFSRTHRNPFKGSNNRRVLRLSFSNDDTMCSEIVSQNPVLEYSVRYIKRPEPIILEDLSSYGLSINGKTSAQTCLLDESIHNTILETAVRLAKAVWES